MKTITNPESEQPVSQTAENATQTEESNAAANDKTISDEYDNYCPWEQ